MLSRLFSVMNFTPDQPKELNSHVYSHACVCMSLSRILAQLHYCSGHSNWSQQQPHPWVLDGKIPGADSVPR